MDMRVYVKERSELATTYAEDGAYRSAERVLRELAETVKQHADRNDEMLRAEIEGGVS